MPDAQQEAAFVKAFISPNRQDRYLSFLANPKKRDEILNRLNHVLDFLPEYATKVPGNQNSEEGVFEILCNHGMKEANLVYLISDIRDLNGLHLPLRQAVEKTMGAYFGTVICCIPGKLAYYRPEAPGSGYVFEKLG